VNSTKEKHKEIYYYPQCGHYTLHGKKINPTEEEKRKVSHTFTDRVCPECRPRKKKHCIGYKCGHYWYRKGGKHLKADPEKIKIIVDREIDKLCPDCRKKKRGEKWVTKIWGCGHETKERKSYASPDIVKGSKACPVCRQLNNMLGGGCPVCGRHIGEDWKCPNCGWDDINSEP